MKYKSILIIFIIAFISSVLLATHSSCEDSCDIVQDSPYGSFENINNGYVGMAIFLFMIIVISLHIRNPTRRKKAIIHAGIIIGALVALYFIYLQQFVIQAYCKYCLVIDFGILIAFIIAIINWKD